MTLKPDEFIVQKVIDVKWVNKSINYEFKHKLYRVRWAGYGPMHDSWEPYGSFNSASIQFVNEFERQFEDMCSELKGQEEAGIDASLAVNILSSEIDEIVNKQYKRNDQHQIVNTMYRVKWKDANGGNTWETAENLRHAQDKIDLYLHKKRIRNRKRSSSLVIDTCNEDSKRRIEHRKFWNSTDKGQIILKSADLYSRVKNRRKMSQENESVMIKEESENNENGVDKSFYCGNLFENLPTYDATQTLKHLVAQAETTYSLSEDEFTMAALNGDYTKVFASMRFLACQPKVDFVKLFLETSRKGFRDIAILLATKVPDLSAEDVYGYSALTMAAHQSDALFAHQLLVMGAPLHQPTSQNHTAKSVALQFKDFNFLRFLKDYEAGSLPF